jgi:cell division protein FtsB
MRSLCVVLALTMVLIGVGIAGLARGLYEVEITRATAVTDEERIRQLEEKVRMLIRAIENYIDNPGCNIPARNTALAKLRWAADEAKK